MLIFDFDGVLINSLDEVTITAYNASSGNLVTSLTALPADLVKLFQRNRFHVQSIGDSIVLMNWCLHHYKTAAAKILKHNKFNDILSKSSVALLERTNLIYKTRNHFIANDLRAWLTLHKPYQPLWSELIRRKKLAFVILTNKNRDATIRLCRYFGLNIKAKDVYSGDQGATKTENMQRIQDRFGPKSFWFIDDSVKNLQELDDTLNREKKPLSLLFASWGYTGPDDKKIAQEAGYPVLQQPDAILLLDGPMALLK
jgi:FMN phosphatase YigB (HAD superfamily)